MSWYLPIDTDIGQKNNVIQMFDSDICNKC